MTNSIDFYKKIFLHVVPVRIIVPWVYWQKFRNRSKEKNKYADKIYILEIPAYMSSAFPRIRSPVTKKKEKSYLDSAVCCMLYVVSAVYCMLYWPVWVNGWVFVYEQSGCGFKSHVSLRNIFISDFLMQCRIYEFLDFYPFVNWRFSKNA